MRMLMMPRAEGESRPPIRWWCCSTGRPLCQWHPSTVSVGDPLISVDFGAIRLVDVEPRDALEAHLADGLALQSRRVRATDALRVVVGGLDELLLVPPQLAQVSVVEAKPRLVALARRLVQ